MTMSVTKAVETSDAIDNLQAALQRASAGRPAVGGFPYLAETLRRAGVTRNLWFLPACQSLYLTEKGPVVSQGMPLVNGTVDVPPFDREALIHCSANGPSRREHVPRVSSRFMAGRSCPLRRRLQ
jgi:uncharacterized protein YbcV (DUF1398 family)